MKIFYIIVGLSVVVYSVVAIVFDAPLFSQLLGLIIGWLSFFIWGFSYHRWSQKKRWEIMTEGDGQSDILAYGDYEGQDHHPATLDDIAF